MGLGVLAAGSVVEASVLSFKAIKKNDVTITPGVCSSTTLKCTTGPVGNTCATNNDCPIGTNNLSVLGGDKIEVNLFLSGWNGICNLTTHLCTQGKVGAPCTANSMCDDFPVDGIPNNVRIFQVKLNRAGFISNDNGTAKPLGFCGPVDRISCTTSAECLAANPAYPICLGDDPGEPPAGCTCSPHTPANGGFITTLRPDFLLFGRDGPLPECVTKIIDYIYFGFASESSVPDTQGVSRYLGTLVLTVSANACGTFTIGSVQDIAFTFIADPASKPNISLPALQPLTLTVGDCSRQLLSCSPGNCNIDARIAHDRLDYGTKKNTLQMVMTFSKKTGNCSNAPTQNCSINSECPTGGTCTLMSAADFDVTVVPFAPDDEDNDIRTILAVTPNGTDPRITTLTLNRRIRQTRWTCIREKGSNKRCCMGSLPADADNSRISQLDDVFEVFDNLQGGIVIPALAIEKCDTDRSLLCSPADLLMVVDELNGADAFVFDTPPSRGVNGDSLPALVPACPTMTMPP